MVMAAVLFATVSVGFLGLWAHHYYSMGRARSALVGQYLAEQMMEECIAARYQLVDNKRTLGTPLTFTMRTTVRGESQDVVYEAYVDTAEPTPGMKLVTVTVAWRDKGIRRGIQYKTYLFRTG